MMEQYRLWFTKSLVKSDRKWAWFALGAALGWPGLPQAAEAPKSSIDSGASQKAVFVSSHSGDSGSKSDPVNAPSAGASSVPSGTPSGVVGPGGRDVAQAFPFTHVLNHHPLISQLKFSSQRVIDGGVLLVSATLKPESGLSPAAALTMLEKSQFQIEKKTISAIRTEDPSSAKVTAVQWLIPVPFNHAPGPIDLIFESEVKGQKLSEKFVLEILDGNYKKEILKVDEKHINPPKKAVKQITKDLKILKEVYASSRPIKLWEGPFSRPVNTPVTSPFGSKRVYNGALKGFHKGVDFKAPTGTPIYAPAPARVAFAGFLYFTGYTVILDHGYGVFTIYGHMSKLKTKNEKILKTGALLGLSGMTGRSSGPHLHWGAVISGEKVSPLELTTVMQ
jgi:murein DD-endopeptidase MepM/ murein hydrolase activator NlpD